MDALVTIHSLWRWVVLLVALAALGAGAAAWFGQLQWRPAERLGLIFTIALDIEVLIGLLDWVLALVQGTNLGIFFTLVHPGAMILAVGIAHMVRVRADRMDSDQARARLQTLGFLASLVVIILAMPGVLYQK
jgi:hypothetical protein